jgi:cation transport protein ChaC
MLVDDAALAGGFWVFGYGSLMWRPGFAAEERQVATLTGHARRFCLSSIRYRGTPEAPGLVLALAAAPGEICTGIAWRVSAAGAAGVLAYLRERELVTYAYREALLPLALADGRGVAGLAYVADPAHSQHRGGLTLSEQAAVIARAEGPAGTNRDYLYQTLAHLRDLGIADPGLEALEPLVRARAV